MSVGEPEGGDPQGSEVPPRAQFEDGLQRERTALAWNRTALALMVAGSLLIERVGPPYLDLFHLPAYCALIGGAIVLWLAATDQRWRSKSATGAAQLRPQRAWGVGLLTLVLNIASLLVVAFRR